MFIPKLYRNENIEEIRDFIEQNSFAILVSQLNQQLWATHIPIELVKNENGSFFLQGHISKANPQWQNFKDESQVLVIFNGPHAYISSSWYNHENVPTWNYIAVHIYGKIKLLEGEALLVHLHQLMDKYEKSSVNTKKFSALSDDFLKRELKGLVGFEIEIQEIQAANKLSQNRNDTDYTSIIHELEQRNDGFDKEVSNEMKKARKIHNQ